MQLVSTLLLVLVVCFNLEGISSAGLQHFRFNQFFPTNGQTNPALSEVKTCQTIRDVIRRNTARFKKVLVRNVNSQVQFANDDSRYMTSRTKSKLDVVATRVREQWGTQYSVRVIKGWTDTVDLNDKLSLHYEGRAVKIQVSDRDRNKLARLAGIASQSGFDWVHYENQDFIYASVIPDVCQTNVDLAIVIDCSGSVGRPNFLKIQVFLKQLVDFYNVGPTGTKIAIVSYASQVTVQFYLDSGKDKRAMKLAIDRIKYTGGGTATGDALEAMRVHVFNTRRGMRSDKTIPKIGILLTDGRSNNGQAVRNVAPKVLRQGISMFSIGVGPNLNYGELYQIATDPDSTHVFTLTSFNDLSGFVDRMSTISCDEGAAVSQCESALTDVEGGSFKYFKGEFTSTTDGVTIELLDRKGISYLYISSSNRNPGPLDPSAIKQKSNTSPKALTHSLRKSKILYISVQGQEASNAFTLNIWNALFPKDKYALSVRENLNAGQFVGTVSSNLGGYTFQYQITHGNAAGAFTIDSKNGQIRTTRQLDREAVETYTLVVSAQDVKLKCHKGRAEVVITVLDDNDNDPKFPQADYFRNIREDSAIGFNVIQIQATDRDKGENGRVSYSFQSGDGMGVLSINPTTGQIKLAKRVDYESKSQYTVQIRGSDHGNPKRTGTTRLSITILDVNEPPYFVTPCAKPGAVPCRYDVVEERPIGTPVTSIQAKDPDANQACGLKYYITSPDKIYFDINVRSGAITTRTIIDRELKAVYRLTVQVVDCGRPSLSATTVVTVDAKDQNDNAPKFNLNKYNPKIREDAKVRSWVVKTVATDADSGKNAIVTYSIVTGGGGKFVINPTTGDITTNGLLDRETKAQYTLTVRATDKGQPSKSGEAQVIVDITDANDNKPIFGSTRTFNVQENSPLNSPVGTVTSTDRDIGINAATRYVILSGNVQTSFRIDPTSGVITVNRNLDREVRDSYKIVIRVNDLGSPQLWNDDTFTIQIGDENDNQPIFQLPFYSAGIKENSKPGTYMTTIKATDKDIGKNADISYSITDGNGNPPTFAVETKTGKVKLVGKLDFGKQKVYRLRVSAKDGGTPQKEGFALIQISIGDSNDFDPKFSQDKYTAGVKEDEKPGKQVIQVKATDQDSGPSGDFSFLITGGNTDSRFTINPNTGWISVAAALDFERQKSFNLQLTVRDNGNPRRSGTATAVISIIDVNDNTPILDQKTYSVREDVTISFEIGTVTATDRDSGINAQLTFTQLSKNTPFAISPQGKLTVTSLLDFEKQQSYVLQVMVVDGGVPKRSATGRITIRIKDVNDNAPEFKSKSFICEILENSPTNSHVCYVTATDKDSGVNKVIIHTIQPKVPGTAIPFIVDKTTGQIKTTTKLDRESKDKYTCTVTAVDGGNPKKTTVVDVIINVKDENDNAPEFEKDPYTFSVDEELPKEFNVGTVKATDKDIGVNAEITYAIIRGNSLRKFSIDVKTGVITAAPKLDREKTPSYTLTVQARDQGTPRLTDEAQVIVVVKDINDNIPKFSENVYTTSIREDAAVGSRVTQVIATDADKGNNAIIKFSITGGANKDSFVIDEDSGIILTKVTLDYETTPSYKLTVTAKDLGTSSLSSISTVSVTIINVDDNAPEFNPLNNTKVSEAAGRGTQVVKFKATDKDGSKLTYKITGGNTNNAFVVNQNTGLLTVLGKLDRETIDKYTLSVTATDQAGQSDVASVPIAVLDVNDNLPIFNPALYSKSIDENGAKVIDVVTLTATDKDIGINKIIVFSIVPSKDSGDFAIDANTGKITTTKSLDRETVDVYNLKVMAKDKGVPSLRSITKLTVTVNDKNDNSPIFEKTDYKVDIKENTGTDAKVVTCKATDIDAAKNGEVSYRIKMENGAAAVSFKIDTKTGKITTTINLDREKKDKYTLVVEASDAGNPSRKTDTTVIVTVLDENDNQPVIISPPKLGPLNENTKVGSAIDVVLAKDNDIGLNAECRYSLGSGNVGNAFKIDPKSGELKTLNALDREKIAKYKLEVIATDLGTPSLRGSKIFEIDVSDSNDNKPKFGKNSYVGSISEDAILKTSVIDCKATDPDTNSNLVYSLDATSGSDDFSIGKTSARISTAKTLDYETKKLYQLTVSVTDGVFTVKQPVTVNVINVNDNAPEFVGEPYIANISESVQPGFPVIKVHATDKDPFGGIKYSFANATSTFTINPQTGDIKTLTKLDRETLELYKLLVKATDGGTPPLSDTAIVTVNIIDFNDNPPEFATDSAKVNVMENKKAGKLIHTAFATDKDEGENGRVGYKFTSVNSDFKIDKVSGKVTTAIVLDREKKASYTVEILAYDHGKPSLTSKVFSLEVNVGDDNDNSPLFTKDYTKDLKENTPKGTSVVQVSATDKDEGVNAVIEYLIEKGDPNNTFTINKNSGLVSVDGLIDREVAIQHVLTIAAKDKGKPSRSGRCTLTVNVIDENDNAPKLVLSSLTGYVNESEPIGTYVVTVKATDKDTGKNGKFTFAMAKNDKFEIDSGTGKVTTKQILDREDQAKHEVDVTVTDQGIPPKSTTGKLTIHVLDIDDNCPLFNPKVYNVTIAEDLKIGSHVVQVKATDKDVGPNAALDYAITEGEDRGAFKIDAVTGKISVAGRVDREFKPVYHLRIRAGRPDCGVKESNDTGIEGGGDKKGVALADVYITVTDVNDEPPKFVKREYNKILADSGLTVLMTVKATDGDLGEGGKVTYAIKEVQRELSGGQDNHIITVEASDLGTPPLKSTATIRVKNEMNCNTINYRISTTGIVYVDLLCKFTKLPTANNRRLLDEKLELDCEAQGNTAIRYRWLKDAKVAADWNKDGKLLLSKIQHEDEGSYSCIASNDAGTIQTPVVTVVVDEIPTMMVQPKDLLVEVKGDFDMNCEARGDPSPSYQWYKNGVEFREGTGYTNQTLRLSKAIEQDAGNYHCVAKNSVGSVKSRIANVKVVDSNTVVEIAVNFTRWSKEKKCYLFDPIKFEEELSKLVGARVSLTKLDKKKFCALDACNPNPCKNKAKCELTTGSESYFCTCEAGWTGQNCDQDVDECGNLVSSICLNSGVCTNKVGSFGCKCDEDKFTGQRCELKSKACKPNPCKASHVCALSTQTADGYQCISRNQVFFLAIEKYSKEWATKTNYEIEQELNRIIRELATKGTITYRRRRAVTNPPTSTTDLSACTARIVSRTTNPDGSPKIEWVLVCPNDTQPSIPDTGDKLCKGIVSTGNGASGCGINGSTVATQPPPTAGPPTTTTIEVVVRENSTGKTLGSKEATDLINKNSGNGNLGGTGVAVGTVKPVDRVDPDDESGGNSTGLIIGIIVAIIVIAVIVVVIIVIMKKKNSEGRDKTYSISARAGARQQSQQNLTSDISMGNVNGQDNYGAKGSRDSYAKTDETFMFDVKKGDAEVNECSWYKGYMTEKDTEDYFELCTNPGSYFAFSNIETSNLILAVKAPAGAQDDHLYLEIKRHANGTFSAQFGNSIRRPIVRNSIYSIVEFYQVNPISLGRQCDFVLTEPWFKTAL